MRVSCEVNWTRANWTGKATIQRNGSTAASIWTGPGKSESGATWPDRKSCSAKYSWFTAATRVVQKAASARVHSTTKRSTNASTSAGTTASRLQGAGCNAGLNASASPMAAGTSTTAVSAL